MCIKKENFCLKALLTHIELPNWNTVLKLMICFSNLEEILKISKIPLEDI